MKKLIIVTMIAACVALCAAVWPHGNTATRSKHLSQPQKPL